MSGDARQASVSLSGFNDVRVMAHVWTLAAAPDAVNPPDAPEVVHANESDLRITGTQFDYTFTAYSDTVLRLTR